MYKPGLKFVKESVANQDDTPLVRVHKFWYSQLTPGAFVAHSCLGHKGQILSLKEKTVGCNKFIVCEVRWGDGTLQEVQPDYLAPIEGGVRA